MKKHVLIAVSPETREQLRSIAAATNEKISAIVYKAVKDYARKKEREAATAAGN